MVTINGTEYKGIVGVLMAIPICVFVFTLLAAIFGLVALFLASPVILIVLLVQGLS